MSPYLEEYGPRYNVQQAPKMHGEEFKQQQATVRAMTFSDDGEEVVPGVTKSPKWTSQAAKYVTTPGKRDAEVLSGLEELADKHKIAFSEQRKVELEEAKRQAQTDAVRRQTDRARQAEAETKHRAQKARDDVDLEKQQREYKAQERERKRIENVELERIELEGEEQRRLKREAEVTQQRAMEQKERESASKSQSNAPTPTPVEYKPPPPAMRTPRPAGRPPRPDWPPPKAVGKTAGNPPVAATSNNSEQDIFSMMSSSGGKPLDAVALPAGWGTGTGPASRAPDPMGMPSVNAAAFMAKTGAIGGKIVAKVKSRPKAGAVAPYSTPSVDPFASLNFGTPAAPRPNADPFSRLSSGAPASASGSDPFNLGTSGVGTMEGGAARPAGNNADDMFSDMFSGLSQKPPPPPKKQQTKPKSTGDALSDFGF
jgi:hypothetical protein